MLRSLFLLCLFCILPFQPFAQTARKLPWKTNIALGDFVITTFLTQGRDGNTILLSSPPNADRRVVGNFKSFAGRLFKKLPKKGSFLNFRVTQIKDSTIGTATMPLFGKLEFRGILDESQNMLQGSFSKDGKIIGPVEGHRSDTTRNNYKHLYPKIIELAQEYIYSRDVLLTPHWGQFTRKLRHLTANAHDDIELFLGFSINSQQLPFSHFNLVLQKDSEKAEAEMTTVDSDVVFEPKSATTGYLKFKNFSSTQSQIAAIMPGIIAKNYSNLIIDLCNNGGGGLEAALELAKYFLKDSVLIGYFPTNKFGGVENTVATLSQLPVTTATTTQAFIEEMKMTAGKTLTAPKPQNPIFGGKLYILTNHKTASTCEPIVYVLKNKQGATVVGQTTAGAMLSASYFTIEGKYKLVLPVADFYAYDGKRLERVGVEPNIVLPVGEDALAKVLALIGEGK